MPILETRQLLDVLKERMAEIQSLDLAVAWITPSKALEHIQSCAKQRRIKIRAIVGLDGNFTKPEALKGLREIAEVRPGMAPEGIFHPKFYLFRGKTASVCWIGSANFTEGGFSRNAELVHEFTDDRDDARRWFNQLWKRTRSDPERLATYIKTWTPPPRQSSQKHSPFKSPVVVVGLIRNGKPNSWEEYMAALRQADAYWRQRTGDESSVLGDEPSLVATALAGKQVFLLDNWNDLTPREGAILMGLYEPPENGLWGYFGSMKGAGAAKSVFLRATEDHLAIRRRIREYLGPAIAANSLDDFKDAACFAIEKISSIKGFGTVIPTRLLALARPDCAVSVNKGSSANLAKLTGLPVTAHVQASPRNYRKLLEWVYRQPWYAGPAPTEPFERTVWSMRAALIDSFVYEHK